MQSQKIIAGLLISPILWPSLQSYAATPREEKGIYTIYSKNVATKPMPYGKAISLEKASRDIADWVAYLPIEDRNAYQYIVIPTVGIVTPIVEVPRESSDYEGIMKGRPVNLNTYLHHGTLHFPGTVMAGESGNPVYFAHSSYYVSDKGRYKTIFTTLPETDIGEEIWVFTRIKTKEYKLMRFQVSASYETDRTDVSILRNKEGKNITVFTCTPIGSEKHRWILQGTLIEEPRLSPSPSTLSGSTQTGATISPVKLPRKPLKLKRKPRASEMGGSGSLQSNTGSTLIEAINTPLP